jgi:MFS family permease
MMLVFAPISARLISRVGAKLTLMLGASVLGAGYLLGFFLMDAPWQLLVACCVASAGVGIGYAAMPTLILDNVPLTEAGSAVGVNALMRSVGTTVAAAVMATVLTSSSTVVGDVALPSEGAFKWCFALGALAAFVGVAIAAFVPKKADDLTPVTAPVAAGSAPGPARR